MGDPLANSYYAATAAPFPAQPQLAGGVSADICVIGGGFTGLSAALSAAEAGHTVVLLEAERIGFGASGRNGGQLIPGLNRGACELAERFGHDRAVALYRLALSARASVDRRIEGLKIACDRKSGHIEAAHKPSHFDGLKREAEFRARYLCADGIELIEPADMRAHVATDAYAGGLLDKTGGHFHPLNYALGLARAALAAGVQIHELSPAIRVADSGEVSVTTPGGSVRAKAAVIACDHWNGDIIPALGRYTVPVMNYNVATAPLGARRAAQLIPGDAAIADTRFVLNYYRLSADKRMIFGGGEKYSQRPPADIAAFVRPYLQRLFPSLGNVPIDYGWGGAVSVSASRLPHFGRRGNCWFAQGFSGLGALLTTLAGEVLAEAIDGRTDRFELFAEIEHRRFPGGQILHKPLAALGLMWFALKDRL
jgi:gamma-glutamylputrescine oxidase